MENDEQDYGFALSESFARPINSVSEPRTFRTSIDHPKLNVVIELLSQRWTVTILSCLLIGHDRFNAISREHSINPNTLRARLRDLEELGLVSRDIENFIPPKVKYGLTQSGREFARIVEALLAWTDRNNIVPGKAVISAESSLQPTDFDLIRESEVTGLNE